MEKDKKLTYKGTTYYNLDDIIEAVDIVIGDDGFRSKEVFEVLDSGFDHIHYPIMIGKVCKMKHEKDDKGE